MDSVSLIWSMTKMILIPSVAGVLAARFIRQDYLAVASPVIKSITKVSLLLIIMISIGGASRSVRDNFSYSYDLDLPLKEKIRAIAQKVYGADDVDFAAAASTELAKIEELGYGKLPVCMAKTQYSLTDNEKVLGRPTGFRITIRQVTLSAAAGFVVAITGAIMKMPGLPKVPSAEKIDVDANGKISGLF